MFFSKIKESLHEQLQLLLAIAQNILAHAPSFEQIKRQLAINNEALQQSLDLQQQIVELLSKAVGPAEHPMMNRLDNKKKDLPN